ncbi:MAG TPA: hypothetical protein PLC53_00015 [Bacilli bacterium]|nr:hypothetical protein [Bacilli bacterium]
MDTIREISKEEVFDLDIFIVDTILNALDDNFMTTLQYSNFRKYDFVYVRICEQDISKFIVTYGIRNDNTGKFYYDTFIMVREQEN